MIIVPIRHSGQGALPLPLREGVGGSGESSLPTLRPTGAMLTALCGGAPWAGGLLLGLFVAGAAGSTMHCVPMCGGFVLGQAADGMARLPAARLCEWQRIRSGALLPYHLGRLTTYAGLGALGGTAAGRLPWFGFASAALLLFGAALFLAHVAARSAGIGPRAGRLDTRHRPAGKAHERWLPARRRTRLPALRFPLRRADDHRGQRQPTARRSRHAGFRARHRPRAGGGRHRRPGGRTTLAARRRGGGAGCDAAQCGAAHRAGAAWPCHRHVIDRGLTAA